jgi:hypothetical protein
MSYDFSISLNGIIAAGRDLEMAARRIAGSDLPAAGMSADYFSLTDFAAQLLEIDRAKTAFKANLQVISTQRELEREALDLFA